MKMLRMAALDLRGKRVLIREDLNVPVQNGGEQRCAHSGGAADDTPGAGSEGRVLIMSHLGRPEEGKFDAEASLAPVARRLPSCSACRCRSSATGSTG
jgi:phosphoglycerate kinase